MTVARLRELFDRPDGSEWDKSQRANAAELFAEVTALTADRDQWKERHDRERAAHAGNLKQQQRVEAALGDLLRARGVSARMRAEEKAHAALAGERVGTECGHDPGVRCALSPNHDGPHMGGTGLMWPVS